MLTLALTYLGVIVNQSLKKKVFFLQLMFLLLQLQFSFNPLHCCFVHLILRFVRFLPQYSNLKLKSCKLVKFRIASQGVHSLARLRGFRWFDGAMLLWPFAGMLTLFSYLLLLLSLLLAEESGW